MPKTIKKSMEDEVNENNMIVDESGGVISRVGYTLRPERLDITLKEDEVYFEFMYPISENESLTKSFEKENITINISKISNRISKIKVKTENGIKVSHIAKVLNAIREEKANYTNKSVLKNRKIIYSFIQKNIQKIVGEVESASY